MNVREAVRAFHFGIKNLSRVKPLQKKAQYRQTLLHTSKSVETQLSVLLYTIKIISEQGLGAQAGSSCSSATSLLFLVPRRRPDGLTGSSVFHWHRNWSYWWGGGREEVLLSVHAGLEGSD